MTNQDGSSKARSTHTHPHHLEQNASEDTLMMDAHSTALGKTYEEFWWTPFSRRTQGWWLWEISGTVLSIACMIAILIILPYLDNSPLNDWRFSVAPSTMISTFITVAKTSMLLAVAAGISQLKWQHFHEETRPLYELNIYDEATRGPWGALAFIFRMRLRTGTLLASLGAFVILFSLTMEPFAQQILSMQTRYIPKAGEKPWISMANSYDHSHSEFVSGNIGFQSAIVTALVNSPLSFSYTCSTGNCSWPDFNTLGICSTCRNVTSECKKKPITLKTPDPAKNESGTPEVVNQYITPGGIVLNISAPFEISEEEDGMTTTYGYNQGSGNLITGNVSDSESQYDAKNQSIINLAVANTSRTSDKFDEAGMYGREPLVYSDTPDILECSLVWCAKSFRNVRVVNGTMGPYIVNNVELIKNEALSSTKNNSWSTKDLMIFNANRSDIPDNFTVALMDNFDLQDYLEAFFEFQVEGYMDSSSFNTGLSLLSVKNTSATIAAVADALTLQLLLGPNTTRHDGTAYTPEIYVKVRWAWLIFPGLLAILGAIFLTTSLIISRRHQASYFWKSSLIPLMFHGISGWDEGGSSVDNRKEMDELAKDMRIRLTRTESGNLKFVKIKPE